jgi:hypothetical protein
MSAICEVFGAVSLSALLVLVTELLEVVADPLRLLVVRHVRGVADAVEAAG